MVTPKNIALVSMIFTVLGCILLYLSGTIFIHNPGYLICNFLGWVLFPTPLYCLIIGGIINSRKKEIKSQK